MPGKLSKVTIDHDEIRRWAEERGGQPSAVSSTRNGGTGIIRIDFPGYSGEGALEPISWDEFLEKFDESNLAFVYQEVTSRGQQSNFNKLVARESVDLETGDSKARPPRRASRQGAARGERRTSSAASARSARAEKPTSAKARGRSKQESARGRKPKSSGRMSHKLSKVTIDHDEIQRWAEERGGQPSAVSSTRNGGTGIIRIDFPGYSGEKSLEPISWDEFFEKFDESNLAFVYQEVTSRGQRSNFNKLVARESVDLETGDSKARPPRRASRQGAARGERRAPSAASARSARAKKKQGSSRGGTKKARGKSRRA